LYLFPVKNNSGNTVSIRTPLFHRTHEQRLLAFVCFLASGHGLMLLCSFSLTPVIALLLTWLESL